MRWKPRVGDVVVVEGKTRTVKGELYGEPFIDMPGDILGQPDLSTFRASFANKTPPGIDFGFTPKHKWETWHYDLLQSVKSRVRARRTGQKPKYDPSLEDDMFKYRIRWYGQF